MKFEQDEDLLDDAYSSSEEDIMVYREPPVDEHRAIVVDPEEEEPTGKSVKKRETKKKKKPTRKNKKKEDLPLKVTLIILICILVIPLGYGGYLVFMSGDYYHAYLPESELSFYYPGKENPTQVGDEYQYEPYNGSFTEQVVLEHADSTSKYKALPTHRNQKIYTFKKTNTQNEPPFYGEIRLSTYNRPFDIDFGSLEFFSDMDWSTMNRLAEKELEEISQYQNMEHLTLMEQKYFSEKVQGHKAFYMICDGKIGRNSDDDANIIARNLKVIVAYFICDEKDTGVVFTGWSYISIVKQSQVNLPGQQEPFEDPVDDTTWNKIRELVPEIICH